MSLDEIKELAGHREVSPWVVKLVQDAVELELEKAAKLVDKILKKNAAASFFGRGEIIEPAEAIRSMK